MTDERGGLFQGLGDDVDQARAVMGRGVAVAEILFWLALIQP